MPTTYTGTEPVVKGTVFTGTEPSSVGTAITGTEPVSMGTVKTDTEPTVKGTPIHQLEPWGFGISPFGDPSSISGEIKHHIRGFGDPLTKYTENNEV